MNGLMSREPGAAVRRARAAVFAWALGASGFAVGEVPARFVTVALDGVPNATRLAAASNGQTLFCLDGVRGGVVAMDPFLGGRVREVIAPPGPQAPRLVAVAAIDTAALAAVCRTGDGWELRTWRLKPDGPVAIEAPTQRIFLGTAAGGDETEVDLAVGGGRKWIAISGLPPPIAPVLRAALARMHVGPLTTRSCPGFDPAVRPVAVASGPHDELVLFEHTAGADVVVSYHDHDGRCVLRLPTGLVRVRDAAFTPGGGALWVLADGADGMSGLWRLDATLQDGRQAIRPTVVLPLADPSALTTPTERALVISHGAGTMAGGRRLERLDLAGSATGDVLAPTAARDAAERSAPGDDPR